METRSKKKLATESSKKIPPAKEVQAKEKKKESRSRKRKPVEPANESSAAKESKKEEPEKKVVSGVDIQRPEEHAVHETGHLYFFYRPKIGVEDIKTLDDVQRMYMVMRPENKYHRKRRLIMFARKTLPDLKTHERHIALVDMVSSRMRDIKKVLDEEVYETITSGQRMVPAARLFGEAVYTVITHQGRGHLLFVLEMPKEGPSHLQDMFNLPVEGSFIVSVSNPDIPPKQNVPFENMEKVEYPPDLKPVFRGRRWASINHVGLLDYQKARVLFIGAKSDIVDEVGDEAEELWEKRDDEVEDISVREWFKDLNLSRRMVEDDTLSDLEEDF